MSTPDGIKQGHRGQLGDSEARRHVDGGALDRRQRRRASRSTRGCRTCRLRSDRARVLRRGRRAVEHAAVPTLRFAWVSRRSARCCSTCRCRSRRAGAGTTRPRTTGCSSSSGRSRTGARRCGRCCGRARRSSSRRSRARRVVDLDVPCSYDLEVAASRYLDALADGEVPLEFLFSGSVFYIGRTARCRRRGCRGRARRSTGCRCGVWKETMERYFRGTAWVRLSKESFDRLSAYKSRNALATWDDALDGAGPMSDPAHARRRGACTRATCSGRTVRAR